MESKEAFKTEAIERLKAEKGLLDAYSGVFDPSFPEVSPY